MFDTASSREDYYKLLAQKIYQIRKELEDRKKKKNTGAYMHVCTCMCTCGCMYMHVKYMCTHVRM